MPIKDEKSPFRDYDEATAELVNAFMGEHIASPSEADIRRELTPMIREALEKDGRLPNRYEDEALIGNVRGDGSEPSGDEDGDYGCPEAVRVLFPNTDRVIADQF